MNSRNGNLMVTVVLVILMMAGVAGMFLVMQALNSANPDPHEESHEYVFEGTIDGIACSGTGKSTYAPESLLEFYYVVDYTVSSVDKTVTNRFMLAFDTDDELVPELYEYVGQQLIGDIETKVWTYSHNGVDYTFYTGGKCVLYLVEIESSELSLVGKIVDPQHP